MKLQFANLKRVALPLLFFTAGVVQAEDSKVTTTSTTSGFEITGNFDFYYQASPVGHAPTPATPAGPSVLEGRTFDRHVNQMTLNMAELSFKKKLDKITLQADVAFGEMIDQLSGGGSQSVTNTSTTNTAANEPTRNITQAILTYALNDRLSFTAGKFYTHLGLEVTKAKDNYQYSRSYTFNYAIPFWHEGLSGTCVIQPNKLTTTLYLFNAWDDVLNPKITLAADYVVGSQKNIPTSAGDASWNGLALYLKAALNSFYTISPRYEMFDDSDRGFAVAGGLGAANTKQKITSLTITNDFQLAEGLRARVEIRSDKSNVNTFFKGRNGNAIDYQDSYTTALLYSF